VTIFSIWLILPFFMKSLCTYCCVKYFIDYGKLEYREHVRVELALTSIWERGKGIRLVSFVW
jgi:hypothetical protein